MIRQAKHEYMHHMHLRVIMLAEIDGGHGHNKLQDLPPFFPASTGSTLPPANSPLPPLPPEELVFSLSPPDECPPFLPASTGSTLPPANSAHVSQADDHEIDVEATHHQCSHAGQAGRPCGDRHVLMEHRVSRAISLLE